jgi:hypothetical protein
LNEWADFGVAVDQPLRSSARPFALQRCGRGALVRIHPSTRTFQEITMNTESNRCTCTRCPGAGCGCGCQHGAGVVAHAAPTDAARCACGPSCGCEGSETGCHCARAQ